MSACWGDPYALIELDVSERRAQLYEVLRDLAAAGDGELLRAHAYAVEWTFRSSGPQRMGMCVGMLSRLAGEVRRRGLAAFFLVRGPQRPWRRRRSRLLQLTPCGRTDRAAMRTGG